MLNLCRMASGMLSLEHAKELTNLPFNFYFYDVETSGFNPRGARVMQFGGQQTDAKLQPIGKPDNLLIKLTPDVLPDPDAILVTGITPQKTLTEGLSEAEFLRHFANLILKPDTVFVGYNNIRFDDEFMRFMLWRNFWDPYQWQWKDGCGRWDLLDVGRLSRALRPDGIKWPFDSEGKPSNRLELLSGLNKLVNEPAHDALADVKASIALARLLKTKQPKLFDYLLNMRDKAKVKALVETGEPLIYTSGRYSSEYEKTTIVAAVAKDSSRPSAIMYDLRVDPAPYLSLSPAELAAAWNNRDKDAPYFPAKVLSYNKCPAIAPLNVLDKASQTRLKLDTAAVSKNLQRLSLEPEFGDKLLSAQKIMWPKRQVKLVSDSLSAEQQLYDGFVPDEDKATMRAVRQAEPSQLPAIGKNFSDERLKALLPLYKARNFPTNLSQQEKNWWQDFRLKRLISGGNSSPSARYFGRISALRAGKNLSAVQRGLLKELESYGRAILPDV